jgi:hypothetical protein
VNVRYHLIVQRAMFEDDPTMVITLLTSLLLDRFRRLDQQGSVAIINARTAVMERSVFEAQ